MEINRLIAWSRTLVDQQWTIHFLLWTRSTQCGLEPLSPRRRHSPVCTFGTQLSKFTLLNTADVVCAIRRLPHKSCAADHIPVSVMKEIAADMAPILTELFNRSRSASHFPPIHKEPFNTPIIKKLMELNTVDVIPISNWYVCRSSLNEWWSDRFQHSSMLMTTL